MPERRVPRSRSDERIPGPRCAPAGAWLSRPSRPTQAARAAAPGPPAAPGRTAVGGFGCGTSSSLNALAGSRSASSDRPSGGRSMARRARPKTSMSRSSSRGPQRLRCCRPNSRSGSLSREEVRRAGRRVRCRRARRARPQRCGSRVDQRPRRARSRTASTRRAGGRPGRSASALTAAGQVAWRVADVRAQADVGADPMLDGPTGRPPADG